MMPVEVTRGDSPIVLGLPHTGTYVPKEIKARLNERGLELSDTDWHIHDLYDGLLEGATSVRATFHRYVIDANRNPARESLYPGQNTTGLIPETNFDGAPIWRDGQVPDEADIDARLETYFRPYHRALEAELTRVRDMHGVAILYDCHSIRGDIPFLFEGRLPDLNVGTNMGTTCDARVEETVYGLCRAAEGYTSVLNGRFKGGWTTRHYGRPSEGWHAIQMEIAQAAYMDEEPPWTWRAERAEPLRRLLKTILTDLADLAPNLRGDA
ncbi:formiminoglutamase [Salinihabitans flavidus]|uniref:Formiminoglutamase n=1 Tax=Salinihabitans flavidus TaxID=569882 RepID=A0A1H8S3I5_9RHOB|nr:N-formylglutamate deformylase [Salinihabitans flavidus]SEO72878.1 formiminoglutamase [Salinihabitans flavidus]